MEKIIKAAVDRGASDLHIKAGDVFRARIDGALVPLTKQALTPDKTGQRSMNSWTMTAPGGRRASGDSG
jgi:Tfp pilus assembly pilus retraction ATPase PilT